MSSDGGKSFAAAATGLPTEEFVSLKAVPGLAGHVWFAGQSMPRQRRACPGPRLPHARDLVEWGGRG